MNNYLRCAMLALWVVCVASAAPMSTVLEFDGLDRAGWRNVGDETWTTIAPCPQCTMQTFAPGDTAYQVMLDPIAGFTQALLVLAVEGLPVPLRFSVTGPFLDRPVVLTFYPPAPVQFIPLPDITHADPARVPDVAAVPEPGAWLLVAIGLAVVAWKRKEGVRR